MFLNIKNTGTLIDNELANLINETHQGVEFNQIYINLDTDTKYKEINIIYPNINHSLNAISLERENLPQNIIDWLNTLQ